MDKGLALWRDEQLGQRPCLLLKRVGKRASQPIADDRKRPPRGWVIGCLPVLYLRPNFRLDNPSPDSRKRKKALSHGQLGTTNRHAPARDCGTPFYGKRQCAAISLSTDFRGGDQIIHHPATAGVTRWDNPALQNYIKRTANAD